MDALDHGILVALDDVVLVDEGPTGEDLVLADNLLDRFVWFVEDGYSKKISTAVRPKEGQVRKAICLRLQGHSYRHISLEIDTALKRATRWASPWRHWYWYDNGLTDWDEVIYQYLEKGMLRRKQDLITSAQAAKVRKRRVAEARARQQERDQQRAERDARELEQRIQHLERVEARRVEAAEKALVIAKRVKRQREEGGAALRELRVCPYWEFAQARGLEGLVTQNNLLQPAYRLLCLDRDELVRRAQYQEVGEEFAVLCDAWFSRLNLSFGILKGENPLTAYEAWSTLVAAGHLTPTGDDSC